MLVLTAYDDQGNLSTTTTGSNTMKDIDAIRDMLRKAGIDFETETDFQSGDARISVDEGSAGFDGYGGFVWGMRFSKYGDLLSVISHED